MNIILFHTEAEQAFLNEDEIVGISLSVTMAIIIIALLLSVVGAWIVWKILVKRNKIKIEPSIESSEDDDVAAEAEGNEPERATADETNKGEVDVKAETTEVKPEGETVPEAKTEGEAATEAQV